MTERDDAAAIGTDTLAPKAGAMLRAEREKRGMHIAALAAAIKVPQRKLEALEADRYDELPDLTFTRALAQAVCRALKLDAQPVLERLPQAGDNPKLARMGGGINAPFREPGAREEGFDWGWLRKPVVWGTLLVLAAALAMAFAPESWRAKLTSSFARTRTPAPVSSAAAPASGVSVVEVPLSAISTAASAVSAEPTLPASAPVAAPAVLPPEAASSPAPSLPTTSSGVLGLRANAQSWVEVQDARGQTLISRHLAAGESVSLDGALPLRVTVGNASATQLTFRGQAVDLSANTLANVARIQLN